MLNRISIKNVAVISALDVSMNSGVTVLTGETGAGKSIIIDSINMILGERTNKEIVRYGADKAAVQAVFDNPPKSVLEVLNENDIDFEDDEIIISRQITAEGKSTARINGVIVPLAILREIAGGLINIHGQHDNQALLNPKKHINFLDEYAQCGAEIEEYKELHEKLCGIEREIKKLSVDEQTKVQRMDLLEYQVNEIKSANLTDGEEEDLKEQLVICENAEKITVALESAYSSVYDSPEGMSAYDSLSAAVESLAEVAEINPVIKSAYDALSSAMYAAEDAAHEIKEFASSVEYDEQTLNDIEERLDIISKLKRKYGSTIAEILEFGKRAEEELNTIKTGDERLEELKFKLVQVTAETTAAGGRLTEIRKAKAAELSEKITQSLSELNMENAALEISVINGGEFYENGMDTVEFMIRTNPGEPMKPLAKIASGGELSRVILAIKSIMADSDSVDTMIFDEIDTGVSGAAASKITQKLVQIGKNKQVICITHLPQLAAAANTHYLIVKNSDGDMASTTLQELSSVQRETELARIIDGTNITELSLSHARQMLENAGN